MPKNMSPMPKLNPPIKLAWLAGILDGEGWITLTHDQRQVGLGNTDNSILSEAKKIISGLDCRYHFGEVKKSSYSRKICFAIRISSRKDILRILSACRPFLVRLDKKADNMIGFVKSRLNNRGRPISRKEHGHIIRAARL